MMATDQDEVVIEENQEQADNSDEDEENMLYNQIVGKLKLKPKVSETTDQ